jgi:exodeoxyribonuclease V alpha subunit
MAVSPPGKDRASRDRPHHAQGDRAGAGGRPDESQRAGARPAQGALDMGQAPAGDTARPGEVVVDGTLARIVFENPEAQWAVARVQVDGKGARVIAGEAEITAVGPLSGMAPGTLLRLRGTWERHPKYGRQLRIAGIPQLRTPETLNGMRRYLGSGVIPGIGPGLADRIVQRFGMETLDVIQSTPGRLQEVPGIGAGRAEKIAAAWKAQHDLHEVMVFLRGYGISGAYAARIYRRYGSRTIAVVQENPYRLAIDIWGIGFKTADTIARNLGMERTAPARLEAGLIHVLGKLAEDGHVHAPEAVLVEQAAAVLEVDPELLPEALHRLDASSLIVRESLGDRGTCVSLASLWEQEHEAATLFAALVATPMRPVQVKLDAALAALERDADIKLTGEQRRAVEAAVMDKCVIVTGGPGVGKTTIVRAIVHLFAGLRRKVALAAPTGRAAKRLAESTGGEAVTLHRLLEYQPASSSFFRGAGHHLDQDVVIVDETSMVDIALFRALMSALSPAAQLVLVGDVDQLPSVGPGAVLADLIASEAATVVRLTEIFRQAQASRIVTAAHEINRGVVPELQPPPGRNARRSDFYFIHRDDPLRARETIVELVAERIPEAFGFDPMADIQVLCPIHRGELGTIALNQALQERLNPPRPASGPDAAGQREGTGEHGEPDHPQGAGEAGEAESESDAESAGDADDASDADGASEAAEIRRGEHVYRVGDKVMQLRNDYDRGVFNGDIGIVRDIVDDRRKLLVDFLDGRVVGYEPSDLDQLIHAYAVSVHKSQGSEYPVVILPLATQHYIMLQRNLLYTAVTRGKALVVIVGSPRAVRRAVQNDTTTARWTWLAERVREHLRA